jgi:D-glycero-D-manno-heptose 1,7-bisphosphate phosphatase
MGDRFIDIGIPEDYARAREQVPVELRTPRRPAIFLDRDGVINHDGKYVHRIEDIEFCPAIFDFCLEAQKRGCLLVVVTNQAGIARGYYGVEVVECLHEWMKEQFAKRGITLTDIIMCPYHEKGTVPEYSRPSLYRKPEPGMILEAVDRWHIDLSRSIMIGDKRSDRIRLPYLTSYVLKSDYVDSGGWDFESLDDLRRTILTTPTNSQ